MPINISAPGSRSSPGSIKPEGRRPGRRAETLAREVSIWLDPATCSIAEEERETYTCVPESPIYPLVESLLSNNTPTDVLSRAKSVF